MAPTSLLSIVSLALLTLFASSFSTPVNALSVQSDHLVRRHADISLSKRSKKAKKRSASNSKRCQAKSSSSSSSHITSSTKQVEAVQPTSTTPKATHTSTTTAPPKSTQTSSGSSSGSSSSGSLNLRGKACLAWPNGNANDLSPWKGSQVDLIYSWDANKPEKADSLGLTYAPMLWGWDNAADFKSKAVKGYANAALGCNEPNESGQSNMNAQSGISLWQQYMLPLANEGYTLISPAMSSRPNGKDWMQTFMQDCGDCKVSGIATHYYGTDLEEFKTYVTYWHQTYNLPVYITEYADQDFNGGPQASMDEIWTFMTGATSWLNSQDWVAAHCWFGAMEDMTNVNPLNSLMNSAGNAPNDLGYYFINN